MQDALKCQLILEERLTSFPGAFLSLFDSILLIIILGAEVRGVDGDSVSYLLLCFLHLVIKNLKSQEILVINLSIGLQHEWGDTLVSRSLCGWQHTPRDTHVIWMKMNICTKHWLIISTTPAPQWLDSFVSQWDPGLDQKKTSLHSLYCFCLYTSSF